MAADQRHVTGVLEMFRDSRDKLSPASRDEARRHIQGEVYRAKDTRLDRTVAIKIRPPHLAESPQRRQRFEREARAFSQLNHPHMCTLFDVVEYRGTNFLVMECIEGETLAER